jgi:UDP-2,3-diacylglucosamine hydrolase
LGWQGADKERIVIFAEAESEKKPHIDYFVCGHRHLPIDFTLRNGHSRYLNLGEWMNLNSYGVFDGNDLSLDFFEMPAVSFRY